MFEGATIDEMIAELDYLPGKATPDDFTATGNNTDGYQYPEFVVKGKKALQTKTKSGIPVVIIVLFICAAALAAYFYFRP